MVVQTRTDLVVLVVKSMPTPVLHAMVLTIPHLPSVQSRTHLNPTDPLCRLTSSEHTNEPTNSGTKKSTLKAFFFRFFWRFAVFALAWCAFFSGSWSWSLSLSSFFHFDFHFVNLTVDPRTPGGKHLSEGDAVKTKVEDIERPPSLDPYIVYLTTPFEPAASASVATPGPFFPATEQNQSLPRLSKHNTNPTTAPSFPLLPSSSFFFLDNPQDDDEGLLVSHLAASCCHTLAVVEIRPFKRRQFHPPASFLPQQHSNRLSASPLFHVARSVRLDSLSVFLEDPGSPETTQKARTDLGSVGRFAPRRRSGR
jgi:hypothetical protein